MIGWLGSKFILVFYFNGCLVEKYTSQRNTGPYGKVYSYTSLGASLIAQLVKNPPAMQETPVQFLGLEDPLEKG